MDSALGALVQGRPIDSVALIPIRGKIISALKNSTEDILKNEEVKAIFSALGCGFFNKYNSQKLRYSGVGIAADQDQDGNNIFVLVATLFYFMCPDLIKEGRLYRIQSPLYILHYKKETIYAFSNEEKEQLLQKHGKNCTVTRIKGLGELTPEDTKIAVFGEQKRWDKLHIEDFDDFAQHLEMMMGKDVPPRKEYIMSNVDFTRVEE
jgi:DNA gyrase subunit B